LPPEIAGTDLQSLIDRLSNFVSLIVGGASKDGVAKTGILPVQPLVTEPPQVTE